MMTGTLKDNPYTRVWFALKPWTIPDWYRIHRGYKKRQIDWLQSRVVPLRNKRMIRRLGLKRFEGRQEGDRKRRVAAKR